MEKEEALSILHSMTKSESLLRHARTVELVMEAYAQFFGEDENEWGICGLLHDADYEKYPEKHPNVIVEILNQKNEAAIAYAISAHYTKWNNPLVNKLDKALLACDELTGFIVACSQIRPDGIVGLTPKSVKKKLKNPKFAAKVDREEIKTGIEALELDETEHIQFIINVLEENKEELSI